MSVCSVLVTCGLWAHTLFVCDPNSAKSGGLCCLAHALELPAVLCPDWLLLFWRRRLKTAKGYGEKTWVYGLGYNALVFDCFYLSLSHSCPVLHPHKHAYNWPNVPVMQLPIGCLYCQTDGVLLYCASTIWLVYVLACVGTLTCLFGLQAVRSGVRCKGYSYHHLLGHKVYNVLFFLSAKLTRLNSFLWWLHFNLITNFFHIGFHFNVSVHLKYTVACLSYYF